MLQVASLHNATKRYGSVTALSHFTLDLHAGEVVTLLGPNGAGKTTAINALLGLTRLNEGSVKVFGSSPPRARMRIGSTPQNAYFPPLLTVLEVLRFIAAHYPKPRNVGNLISETGLDKLKARRCGGLSGGEIRRVALAAAFIGNPDLALLDEPTTGLDVTSRREAWDMIDNMRRSGGSVILTTHYVEEATRLSTRIEMIADGKNLGLLSVDGRVDTGKIAFHANRPPELSDKRIQVEHVGNEFVLSGRGSDELIQAVVASGEAYRNLRIISNAVEEAFLATLRSTDEPS